MRGSIPAIICCVLLTVVGCSGIQSTELSADSPYSEVDSVASRVTSKVLDSLKKAAFKEDVRQAFAAKPSEYMTSVFDSLPDADYRIGTQVFHNVKAAAIHGKDIQANLKKIEGSYHSMADLFKAYGYSSAEVISAADIRTYFRFTMDFLGSNGFANEGKHVLDKYTYAQLIEVMRTGVYITQLPEKNLIAAISPTAAALLSPGTPNSGGSGSAGAANAAGGNYTGTRYDNSAQACPDYKDGGKYASQQSQCVSPSENSALYQDKCYDNPVRGQDPVCPNIPCGKKVKITNLDNNQTTTAIICGACPANHSENSGKGAGNPCHNNDNLDMTNGVAQNIGFGDANNYNPGVHTNKNIKAEFE